MTDFATQKLLAPASDGFAITPSDTTDHVKLTRGIWVATAGNLHVLMGSGAELTFVGLPAGTLLPLCVKRVYATGTTCTGLIGVV